MSKERMNHKIRAMNVYSALGDALGLPFECMSYEECQTMLRSQNKSADFVQTFYDPSSHKWFKDKKLGAYSDDTQLTYATLKGLLGSSFIDMSLIASEHVKAMQRYGTAGWGQSTRTAVERLRDGVHWSVSGVVSEKNKGCGNGVLMKIAPLAVMIYKFFGADFLYKTDALEVINTFTNMTHNTPVARIASIIHVNTLIYCLISNQYGYLNFDSQMFLAHVKNAFEIAWNMERRRGRIASDSNVGKLKTAFDSLYELDKNFRDPYYELMPNVLGHISNFLGYARKEFNNASCALWDSLPMSYFYFLSEPLAFDKTVATIACAGGDTDTNASIVGGLFGSLYGKYESAETLFSKMEDYEELDSLAKAFALKVVSF